MKTTVEKGAGVMIKLSTDDVVKLSADTAEALDALGLGHIGKVNTPEHMAWILQVLKHVPDTDETFPHGKWATIQYIEVQVERAAKLRAQGGES